MLSFTKENVIIPKESIRYRIVANSNNEIDQYNKLKANEVIFPIINDIMNNSNNIIEARKNINKNIDKEDNVVMFVYDDKKIFEKSKAYRVSI